MDTNNVTQKGALAAKKWWAGRHKAKKHDDIELGVAPPAAPLPRCSHCPHCRKAHTVRSPVTDCFGAINSLANGVRQD